MVNATPRPFYPRERDPVPISQKAGWVPGVGLDIPIQHIESHVISKIRKNVYSVVTGFLVRAHIYVCMPLQFPACTVRSEAIRVELVAVCRNSFVKPVRINDTFNNFRTTDISWTTVRLTLTSTCTYPVPG